MNVVFLHPYARLAVEYRISCLIAQWPKVHGNRQSGSLKNTPTAARNSTQNRDKYSSTDI